MEVQPINILLNTSTDDESETETSILQDSSITQNSSPSVPPGFTSNYMEHAICDGIIDSIPTLDPDTCIPYNLVPDIQMSEVCQPSENLAMPVDDVKQTTGEIITGLISPDDVTEFIPREQHLVRHLVSEDVDDLEGVVTHEQSGDEIPSVIVPDIMPTDMAPSPVMPTDMTPLLMMSDANNLMYNMNSIVYAMPTGQYSSSLIDAAPQYYDPQAMFGGYNMAANPMESESTVSMAPSPVYDPASSYPEQYPEFSQSDDVMNTSNSPVTTAMEGSELGQEILPCQALVFPSLYVSSAGLLTVFLRHDVAVELTLDRAIRVVNNRHRAVAATNNSGNCSCIHHPAAKIYQEDNTTESELFWDRRAKLTSHRALFACGNSCFQLGENGMQCALPEFSELSNDMSVTLLFSSSGYGPQLTSSFEELVSNATYRYYKDGGISVRINGMKINQNSHGDVTVTAGRKFIRASPVFGSMYIETPLIQMSVEMNWNVKIQRGDYRLNASFAGLMVSDGTRECGFDQYQQVFIQPITVRKQAIIRNGVSVTRPWGQNSNNRYNDRYHYNRYYYNRYQNYCNMNYNNHSNNKYYSNQNRSRIGSNHARYKNNQSHSSYGEASPSSSSNSLHNSSPGAVGEVE